ncbi:MAG: threonine/serine dehydratase [Bacillota bacterium]|nr:threonine/serine dehydratase [Bacillota bacterium]
MTFSGVLSAARRIERFVLRTPLVFSDPLSEALGAPVHIKMENFQAGGSFKLRGAASRMLLLTDDEKRHGLITASSGNHARAVAIMARHLGLDVVVVMPDNAPAVKVEASRRLGAQVVLAGADYDRAEDHAHGMARARGRFYIHAFMDPVVIEGQGTVGLEIIQDLPGVEQVIVPAGGGGLICGVAVAIKAVAPGARIVGVQGVTSPAWYESWRAGRVVDPPVLPTLADGTAGGISQYTFDLARKWVDDFLLVSEEQIRHAVRFMVERHRIILEGAGALGVAAVLAGHPGIRKRPSAIVLSGQNIDHEKLLGIICEDVPHR